MRGTQQLISQLEAMPSSSKEEGTQLWRMSEDGEHFITPNSATKGDGLTVSMSQEMAVDLITEVFQAAAEREISIGDGVDIWILTKPPPSKEQEPARRPALVTKRTFSLPSH